MKAIILAGGYARRLWPITKNMPKSLLTANDKPIISYIIEKLEKIGDIDDIFISTNQKFEKHFEDYISKNRSSKRLRLVVEKTKYEGEKLGSVGGLNYLINKKKLNEDILVVGGDNIFDFDLLNLDFSQNIVVGCHDVEDVNLAKEFGIVLIDKNNVIIDFEEKPVNPKSTLVSTAIYFFPRKVLPTIQKYIDEGNHADKMGIFIKWLTDRETVIAHPFKDKWFDIGSYEILDKANEHYKD